MKTTLICVLTLFLSLIQPIYLLAEDQNNIDGTTVTYTYKDLGTVEVAFYNGLIKYEWIAGAFKGIKGQDYDYNSKKIGRKMYLIHWHQSVEASLVTLVIDFKKRTVYSSALLNSKSENEAILFHHANINAYNLIEK